MENCMCLFGEGRPNSMAQIWAHGGRIFPLDPPLIRMNRSAKTISPTLL